MYNITRIKNLISQSNIKISKDSQSNEYDVINDSYKYRCKSDLELLECLKHLTKEQKSSSRNKNVFTPIKKPAEEIEATLSFYDSCASLNDSSNNTTSIINDKVNDDDYHLSTNILHNNKNQNINNFNYLNIDDKEIEQQQQEEAVIIITTDVNETENNTLKINLNSSSSSSEKTRLKDKKKLFSKIIAQNNLTNKVNKIKNERY